MNWSKIFRPFVPEFAIPSLRKLISKRQDLAGDYSSWQAALSDSKGYNNPLILEKTKQAMLKVKNGDAVHERDSVLFDKIEYSWPLLAGLMWVAASHGGVLKVLDFGGSLGTTYFQNRLFLKNLDHVEWNIVEQEHYVDVGNQFFQDSCLRFYASVDECIASSRPNVAICSSSLQYLEKPHNVLSKLGAANIMCLIIDRIPFHEGGQDRLYVQHVPQEIYQASYPSWIFSYSKFVQDTQSLGFAIQNEFQNDDSLTGPIPFIYKGMILTRCHIGLASK